MNNIVKSKSGQQIEIYRKQDTDVNSLKAQLNISSRTTQLCKELGFDTLAKQSQGLDPKLFYHEVTLKEEQVWKLFLPTTYYQTQYYMERTWKDYTYDSIPEEVLEEINFANKTGFFKSLHIRTPEKVRVVSDPACFGITEDDRIFLIVRWGESLIPYKKIKRLVRWKNKILPIIIIMLFLLAFNATLWTLASIQR